MHKLLLKGNTICRINGILFDKDGTLINSENRLLSLARSRRNLAKRLFQREGYTSLEITNLVNMLSKAYGLKKNSIDPNGSIAIASRNDNLISTATIFCLIGKNWPEALQIANQVFDHASQKSFNIDCNNPREELLPGVVDLLKESNNRKLKLGIISNDSRNGIDNFLVNNKLKDQFSYYWSSEDNPPKPNPIAIKKLCKIMNLRVSECALIGDSDTDLKMAKAAGVAVAIGYTAGWRKAPLLYEHHHLISNWNELSFQ